MKELADMYTRALVEWMADTRGVYCASTSGVTLDNVEDYVQLEETLYTSIRCEYCNRKNPAELYVCDGCGAPL